MVPKDYVKTDVKFYIDGKEITNFFAEEEDVHVIGIDEANSSEVVKRYDSFTGTITLTTKQVARIERLGARE